MAKRITGAYFELCKTWHMGELATTGTEHSFETV
jgi:hypothetical protein